MILEVVLSSGSVPSSTCCALVFDIGFVCLEARLRDTSRSPLRQRSEETSHGRAKMAGSDIATLHTPPGVVGRGPEVDQTCVFSVCTSSTEHHRGRSLCKWCRIPVSLVFSKPTEGCREIFLHSTTPLWSNSTSSWMKTPTRRCILKWEAASPLNILLRALAVTILLQAGFCVAHSRMHDLKSPSI